MKNSAIVDGVVLTREQVERAVKQLNEPPVLQAGSLVKVKHWNDNKVYMIIGGSLNDNLNEKWGKLPLGLYRFTDGSNTWGGFEAHELEVVKVQ